MAEERSLLLKLWDCRELNSEADVLDLVRLLRNQSVLPATGGSEQEPARPVDDFAGLLASQHHDWAAMYPEELCGHLQVSEDWGCLLIRPDAPHTAAYMSVEVLQPDLWTVSVDVHRYGAAWVSLSAPAARREIAREFRERWAPALEDIGLTLYSRARPVLAAITTLGDPDEDPWRSPNYHRIVPSLELMFGWCTWFGPPYVEKFGRDWLLQLPGRTAALANGDISHRLDAPVMAVSRGERSAFAAVQAYLRDSGHSADWPRFLR